MYLHIFVLVIVGLLIHMIIYFSSDTQHIHSMLVIYWAVGSTLIRLIDEAAFFVVS